jgi:hypothetical protein
MKPIEFVAVVYKVQTLVDNGIRVTLDLSEDSILQMAQLAECQRFGAVLKVSCKTTEKHDNATVQMATRTKRKSEWATKEEAGADSGASERH